MTPQEFKAWFEGFTEAFDRIPTKAQWARVKERVGEIDGEPVTERVFVDRYYPTYPPRYWSGPTWACLSAAGNISANGTASVGHTSAAQNSLSLSAAGEAYRRSTAPFNSGQAMLELGRTDAKALAS